MCVSGGKKQLYGGEYPQGEFYNPSLVSGGVTKFSRDAEHKRVVKDSRSQIEEDS